MSLSPCRDQRLRSLVRAREPEYPVARAEQFRDDS